MTDHQIKIRIEGLSFSYQGLSILNNADAVFSENAISAIIGHSGAGKSTFLMILNRLWESTADARMSGSVQIRLNGRFSDIYDSAYSPEQLRRSVGMVFQMPNPLPMSIYRNIAFPLKLAGFKDKKIISEKAEQTLKQAYLWNEVKDRLEQDARKLSGGQQQRLCIARSLILQPEVLLLDEPASSLDAKSSAIIEELLINLKKSCTLIVVSHYMDQVARIADTVYELSDGKLKIRL
ncbi:MAG TPA: phosphate ABC transporter ATP-binding protein [Desulfobacteraceae bacterium]|jgi:phosphate transport system ATP-binding protein|nr:phosphate ABC transporter ATP-binding protein [Desulfobacteraceae bacterium]